MTKVIVALGALALTAQAAAPSAPVIHVDQLGFTPDGPKRAIVASTTTLPLDWTLLDAVGRAVASGRTTVVGGDAASGDHVHRLDVSKTIQAGEYRLRVGGTISHPFPIRAGIFAPLATASLNYFYQTRAGIPIEARYAGGATWARPAGHPHEVAPCFAGPDDSGTTWPGCAYKLDVTGGWYDAGDQGKYVVNGGIALWTLQDLWEAVPGSHRLFADGQARLPEAGNGRPDLLDEARWEMRFLLAMQVPEGTRMALPVGPQPRRAALTLTTLDAGGMVHQKVADRNWTPLPTPPQDDPEPRLLYPPSTAATLNMAATAAQAARIWRPIDPAFADTCLHAAERAWHAARRNPEIYAAQGFTGSGGYGDTHLSDEFYWAAAELYATTQAPEFGVAVRAAPEFRAPLAEPNWGSTAALGTITLATVPGALPPAEQAAQRALIVAAADRFVAEEARSGYGLPYAGTALPWGSNSTILNRAMLIGLAGELTRDPRYRAAAVDAIDYVLGRNPLGQSYVSGFGWQAMSRPHHRFWAHSLDPKLPPPPPGVLSGGPNSTSLGDAKAELNGCAPMRCWEDDPRRYTVNEVAINWNAPLVWTATYLATTK
jgi:endoglucanase